MLPWVVRCRPVDHLLSVVKVQDMAVEALHLGGEQRGDQSQHMEGCSGGQGGWVLSMESMGLDGGMRRAGHSACLSSV